MDIQQDVSTVVPNAPTVAPVQGTDALPPNGQNDLSQFAADSPNVTANPLEADVQGGQVAHQPTELEKAHQRLAEQRQVEIYKLQQENARLQQMAMQQHQQPSTTDNPYDFQTDYPNWFRFENSKTVRMAAEESRRATLEAVQGLAVQANENSWANQHRAELNKLGIDVNFIKDFNRQNGLAEWNLDWGLKMLTYPNQLANAAYTASTQTINQFRQPQTGVQPIRGTGSGVQPTQLSLQRMLEAYNQNPDIEDTWSPELRAEFWRHVHGNNVLNR